MPNLADIKPQDRRVSNIRDGKFVTLISDGVEDGSVLQLNDAKPLGTGFHIYRMSAGDLVWLRKGTQHTSYSPNGCLIVVYLEADES